jgi:hypothetical protein
VLWAMLLMALAMTPTRAGERLDLRVTPAVAFEPATVNVRAIIAADDDHRALEVIAESDDYYRSSYIQLDGGSAPRTTEIAFRGLPSGQYTVRAIVFGSRGETTRTERTARIVDRGPGPQQSRN